MNQKPIPYAKQYIDDVDIAAVNAVLRGPWLTQGPLVKCFEEKIADFVGANYAVAFNSGTSALHGAMFAAGISQGDEVITSPITFVATANAVQYLGGRPRFVDIDKFTYCIDVSRIEEVISHKTKVIAPVDFAGYPVDIHTINNIAKDNNLTVIEDAAHALGASRNGVPVGSEADMTMFSFHPVKLITTGEGGIITTNRKDFADKLRTFRSHGIVKEPDLFTHNNEPWYYEMQSLGYNYRITDIQCALGLSQIDKIKWFIQRRNEIARVYKNAFRANPYLILPPEPKGEAQHAYHLYPLRIVDIDRKKVFLKLREMGIVCQVHYIPIHLQPYYREEYGYQEGDYPVSEEYYQSEISIPMYPSMSDDDVTRVIESVNSVFNELKRGSID